MIAKYYDLLFYRMYKVTYRTNKSITEWSTIIWMSVLLSLNVFSLLIYFDFPIAKLKRIGFMAIPLLIIILNYLCFLYKNRYLKILDEFDKSGKAYFLVDVFSFLYALFSFVVLFKLLNAKDEHIYIVVFLLCAVSLYSYLAGRLRSK